MMSPRKGARQLVRLAFIINLVLISVTARSSSDLWSFSEPPPRRRRVHFGNVNELHQDAIQLAVERSRTYPSTALVRRTARAATSGPALVSANEDLPPETGRGNRFWPPWPFNILTQPKRTPSDEESYSQDNRAMFWVFFRHNLRVGFRQIQQIGNQLWFHLPPAVPPLILLSLKPVRRTVELPAAEGTGEMITEQVRTLAPTLFSNPFIRKIALVSLCAAILSWSHSEIHRVRQLVPLPLPDQYSDVYRAILPPFLPEEVPEPEIEFLRSMEEKVKKDKEPLEGESEDQSQGLSPKVKRHLQQLYDVAPNPRTFQATFKEWQRMRVTRRLEAEKVRRATIVDELIALQALKKRAKRRKRAWPQEESEDEAEDKLGYALVTGASRGIGRAIAVELARWEIPLILVARDVDRLANLATDIEACYGVKCCVLEADLNQPDAAERIHKTTQAAGFKVDILVNNAGVSSAGLSVDMPSSSMQNMLQVNVMSVATLAHLYGKDMKDRGRGRMLVVSSVVGNVAAGPNVAYYAGTKAFERSLAMSMARELEPYGVGVTCLMPGAVRGTDFRSRSNSETALCWRLPYYPKSAATVAKQGVRGLLAGNVQCVPGWQNRVFLRVMKPMLPQRLTTLIVEMAWSPFQLSKPRIRWGNGKPVKKKKSSSLKTVPGRATELSDLWPGGASRATPRMLKLPVEANVEEPTAPAVGEIMVPATTVDGQSDATTPGADAGEGGVDNKTTETSETPTGKQPDREILPDNGNLESGDDEFDDSIRPE